ncbi:methylthioribulose 1-phosphate dehydratase [Micromonospora sp. ALFpr18c]|uniref:methylthioribulose 1-phosphate dehydratase n=1 Tax=Micromonospora sp. ALFpr18c TaxID=1458665 RepID=UPI00124B405F|nr:methylthioribulose 1-phosphate dehydratase [Micromonospora sp. ALFpr18c]KAB1935305.1 methylthioribulose 1-phosphate dehydratase [Micromonospora sp. ALFpr18c]
MTIVAPGASPTELAAELAAYSRSLYELGWMPGTAGNLSVRFGDRALITASGRNKGELTADDMIEIWAESGAPSRPGQPRPSAETCIHAAVYRTTDAAAVVHVHSPYATAVARRNGLQTGLAILPLTRFELLKGLGIADPSATGVPIYANWADVPRIAADVEEHLTAYPSAPPGLLITDHGITTWGRDLSQARNRLECLESICQVLMLTDFRGVPL